MNRACGIFFSDGVTASFPCRFCPPQIAVFAAACVRHHPFSFSRTGVPCNPPTYAFIVLTSNTSCFFFVALIFGPFTARFLSRVLWPQQLPPPLSSAEADSIIFFSDVLLSAHFLWFAVIPMSPLPTNMAIAFLRASLEPRAVVSPFSHHPAKKDDFSYD